MTSSQKIKISWQKIIVLTAVLLLLAFVGGITITFFLLKEFHRLDTYKADILKEVRNVLHREVSYDKGEVSFVFAPAFTFSRVVIHEKGDINAPPFVTAERISFRLALLPLLVNKVAISDICVEKPQVNIHRYPDGTFNISDLLTEKSERRIHMKALQVKNGMLKLQDDLFEPLRFTHTVKDINIYLSNMNRGEKAKFRIQAAIPSVRGLGLVNLSGKARLSAPDRPFFNTDFDVRISAKNLDASPYWYYYQHYVPFERIIGHLDLMSTFKGKLHEFESKGDIEINGLRFHYPQVFHAVLAPHELQLHYRLSLNKKDIKIDDINLIVDGFHARGDCAILDIPSKNPQITAHAVTEPFKLEANRQYIPFGIIPNETSEFIEKYIKAGNLRLDEGRLDGRVSQIAHMWEKDNYRVLSIHGTVLDGGVLRFSDRMPSFNGIQGKLILEGKNFMLQNMSGKFGTSPFRLNGIIADYCLETPTSYPFSMAMIPQKAEIAWLIGETYGSKLGYIGRSMLRLDGRGYSNDYQLSGAWNLKQAAYRYGQMISKPSGRDNRISFVSRIGEDGFDVTSFQYGLSPLAIAISAKYKWGDKEKLAMNINSNPFRIDEVAGFAPILTEYKPKGVIQVAVKGESGKTDPLRLDWRGAVSLRGVSFILSDQIKTLNNINGVINIQDGTLGTSQISARIGTSSLMGSASLKDFQNPVLNVEFTCPDLELSNLGWKSSDSIEKLTEVKGNFSFHDGGLDVSTLSGRIDNSSFQIRGKISDLSKPVLNMRISSPYLEMEDFLNLSRIPQTGSSGSAGEFNTINAVLAIEKGKWHHFQFKELRGRLAYENEILKLSKLNLSAMEGKMTVGGQIDFNNKMPKYDFAFATDKMSAEQVGIMLGVTEQITGSMSAQGQLAAAGESLPDLEKTMTGFIDVHASKGMMKQFPILSKIFSILNVSQLFKFQLPDMVSGGMPYNEINGRIDFKDGNLSTTDLFVKSNAMNIAFVGQINVVRNEIDATVGIRPLQTVDKIVSRIPVIGWIITGKEGSFVTTYFQVKGKLEDPTVTAIPFKAMASGVFDIFKRVFQLPVKIFTNTGEVFIGK